MSHLKYFNFCLNKIDLSGNTVRTVFLIKMQKDVFSKLRIYKKVSIGNFDFFHLPLNGKSRFRVKPSDNSK